MTSSIQSEFIPLRKDHLRYQISEALELGDNEKLNTLRAQWVHRFGIKSLNEFEQITLDVKHAKELNFKDQIIMLNSKKEEIYKELNKSIEQSNIVHAQNSLNVEFTSQKEEFQIVPKEDEVSNLDQQEEKLTNELIQVDIPSPPIPSLSHLRRWLPSIGNSISKAS